MKTLLIAAVLGIGIFLTGCVPIFVERRHNHGNHDGGRHSYGDGHYRDSYNGTHDRTRQ